jgi:hypothetical protein
MFQKPYWLCVPLFALGCADAEVDSQPVSLSSESLSVSCAPEVPEALAVPAGHELALVANAEGAQVYVCQAGANGAAPAWTLERPDALLFGKRGRVIGHHYEGPTWEGLDKSSVVGKRIAAYDAGPTTIPWLLLEASNNDGDGIMSKVTYIQRLDTEDGLAPKSGCDSEHLGAHVRSEYTATYYFYAAANSGKKPRH